MKIVKTRTKLKTGLFGNVYSRKTIYDCVMKLKPGVTIIQPGPSVSTTKGGEVRRFLDCTDLRITDRDYRTAGD